ncbi:hypothetical protein Syun_003933 [Stephania yunnanensis]|uniref:DOG1 domain-containing protein n=1 Tax=Stephania yunnanensis TaxID=152371 RepID=A0AAP0Q4E3_9MAGN
MILVGILIGEGCGRKFVRSKESTVQIGTLRVLFRIQACLTLCSPELRQPFELLSALCSLQVLMPQLDPLTEQQLVEICNLQQCSQQAEDALSQGLDKLQQTLADTLASDASNAGSYMTQMAEAMDRLEALVSFVNQADHLRQQALQQLSRILTVRQVARGLLALGDYFQRLRALSSLWAARPREPT